MRRGRGRPISLTPDIAKRIFDAVSIGATKEIAAGYAGVSARTIYKWLSRGEEGEEPFCQFLQDYKMAEAKGAIKHLGKITQAAHEGTWQASAWILERRHGYFRNPEVIPVSIQIDAEQVSVSALIEELKTPIESLKAIDGPVIDVGEE